MAQEILVAACRRCRRLGVGARLLGGPPGAPGRTHRLGLLVEPVKGVDAETLTAKVIDNSVVDKLVKDGFIEKVFAKAAR